MATSEGRRVGSAEREAAAGLLGEHFARGHLTVEEFQARLDAAFAAAGERDLAGATAGLPALGARPGPGRPGLRAAGGYRRRGRRSRARFWLLAAPVLALFAAVTGVAVLIAALLPHSGWVLAGLALLAVPAVLFCSLVAAAIWAVRRAWRRAAWLELLPLAAGGPWLSRLVWLARAVLAGRALHRYGTRAARRPGPAGSWHTGYSSPGARWS
jgi:DUF1707 SHOCT-like domain